MAKKKKKKVNIEHYTHDAKRKNNPPAKMVGEGNVPKVDKAKYAYSPHLDPVLRFDSTGKSDVIEELLTNAKKRPLSSTELETLRLATSQHQPWLEWSGKQEEHDRGLFEVDPVALHIHERVSTNAIMHSARRKDVERSLFADPEMDYKEAIQFYQHDMNWANRLILGDSLQVMSSLAHRENMVGKVQMVYLDPPYGIKYASNFQSNIRNRNVKEKESDLTREPEMVRAYRDTWNLGIHSYLDFLRDRLMITRELLTESGAVFVQISSENLHRVKQIMDEIFGHDNFISTITFRKKTRPLGSRLLENMSDYLLFYARNKDEVKFNTIYDEKSVEGNSLWKFVELSNGKRLRMSPEEIQDHSLLPIDSRVFRTVDLRPAGFNENATFDFHFQGKTYLPPGGSSWVTSEDGITRLSQIEQLIPNGKGTTLERALFLDSYPVSPLNNLWSKTSGPTKKIYCVQTSDEIVKRCLLMCTDPGDLVLDPTCGSGTTAYVAETWGRRWITIDSSRVSLSLARQRILVSKYPGFKLTNEEHVRNHTSSILDPKVDFVYKTVPHIKLSSIMNNIDLESIIEKHQLVLSEKLISLNRIFLKLNTNIRVDISDSVGLDSENKFEHWQVPFDTDPDWPQDLQDAVLAYRKAWREKMGEVNACIAANAEQEVLVDQPEVVPNVVRVSGPFTVEGVMPAELSLLEEGLFTGGPESLIDEDGNGIPDIIDNSPEMQNTHAYLEGMCKHIEKDGVKFLNNQQQQFARLDALFGDGSGSPIHAEAVWKTGEASEQENEATVAIAFGPQYGPVTAVQVEDIIHAARGNGYKELVVAGFSFDPESTAVMSELTAGKLQVHLAHIRPDINPGMDGLLKDTANSELFTVFGLPDVSVEKINDEYQVTLDGVSIYDPIKSVVYATKSEKVAAWFLDSDYDGRCFCITQAFFPDQDAWGKLAKALKDVIEPDDFAAFKGTTSLPFEEGKYKKIAVKVIDPRGNEVMIVKRLSEVSDG